MSTLKTMSDAGGGARPFHAVTAPPGGPAVGPRLWREEQTSPPDAGAANASLARAVSAANALRTPFAPLGPLTQAETCDVLIIGAGVSGAFAAQQLAAAGLDVVLVDRSAPASGSTGQSTALVQYEPDVPLVELIPRLGLADAQAAYRALRGTLDDLRQLCETRALDCDLVERSALYLARTPDDVGHLQHESFAREQIGLAAPFVAADALASRYGVSRPGALWSPLAYELDPRKLTLSLLADAAHAGARVYNQTSVHADPWVGGLPALRTQDGYSIHCDHVVYAIGYAAIDQFPALRPLCDLRTTFAVIGRPAENDTSLWWNGERPILWELGDAYFYARSTIDGRVILGGGDVPRLTPDGMGAALDRKIADLLQRLEATTGIRDFRVEHSFGATFAQTVDGLPYIGSPDCSDRCFFALGYGGNGILFSLVAAQVLRDRLTGRSHPAERLFGFGRKTVQDVVSELNIGSCP